MAAQRGVLGRFFRSLAVPTAAVAASAPVRSHPTPSPPTPAAGPRRRSTAPLSQSLVFDLVGVALLTAAGLTPWTTTHRATDRPSLLAALAVAALGILLPHLMPSGFGRSRQARLTMASLRGMSATPLVISVILTVFAVQGRAGMLGVGVAFATCGAFVAAVPPGGLPGDRHLAAVLHGVAGAAFLAAGGLALVDALLLVSSSWDNPILWATATPTCGIAVTSWWIAWLVIARDQRASALAGVSAAAWPMAALVLMLLEAVGGRVAAEGSLLEFGTSHLALATALGVGALLLNSPAARWATPSATDPQPSSAGYWLRIVAGLQVLAAVGGAFAALRILIVLTWNSVGMIVGTHVVAGALLYTSVSLALTVMARALLLRAPIAGRLFTVAAGLGTLALVAVGIVLDLVAIGNEEAITWVALPLSGIVCLVFPPSVRRELGPILPRDGWHGLGLTREPQYAGAPPAPLPPPIAFVPEELFADLDGSHDRS